MENKSFGECLKEMRIYSGKTVSEASSHLISLGYKASEKTIYSWESCRSQPTPDPFLELCRFYGVTDVLSWFRDVPEISDVISLSEREHIKKYRFLDPYGKEAVDGVLDVEYRRCEEERKAKQAKAQILHENKMEMETAEEITCYILPYYLHPSSAGTGKYSSGDEWEELTMKKRPPRGTSYVVRVHGDSMEPTYHDGDKVFVRAGAEVRQGQIGIFIMDGEQYIKELGYGELISHNPDYGPKPMTEDAHCQGLVLDVCDDSYFE